MTNDRKNQSGLFIHSGGRVSYYYFRDEVVRRVSRGQNDYLYFMPVNRAVRRLKRQLTDEAPGQALIDPPVFTFDDFLLSLYRRLPHPRKILQNDIVYFFIEDILQKNTEMFSYLLPNNQATPGLVKKAADMISEFRRFGYDSARFEDEYKNLLPAEQQKYTDFKEIITRLEQRFGKDYIDEPFARHQAGVQLNRAWFEKNFPNVKNVYIAGYGLFTPAMYLFIQKTSQWMPVHIKLEYSEQNTTLFQQTAEAFSLLSKMGGRVVREEDDSVLALYLFNRDNPPPQPSRPPADVQIRGCLTRKEEITYIARQIARLRRDNDLPLHRIAVTFPNLERYIPLLRKIFDEYGIPYNLSTGYRLHQSPLIQTFLRSLQVIESRFEYRKTLELLTSPFLGLQDKVNLYSLHQKLIEQRRRYLPAGWDTAFLENLPEDERGEWRQPLEEIKKILEPLYSAPAAFTPDDFRGFFISLLRALGLLEWYNLENNVLSDRQKENEFRAFNRFMKQFERFIWALRHTDAKATYSLAEISGKLITSLSHIDYNLTEWPDYGVQIMPRLEIQATEYEWLFLGGLTDGEFPRSAGRDVFFNDAARRKLGLLASEELLHQDRFIFYSLLESGAKGVRLTYSLYEEDRVLVPSTFLDDLDNVYAIPEEDPAEESDLPTEQNVWEHFALAIQNNRFDEASRYVTDLLDRNEDNRDLIRDVIYRIGASHRRYSGNVYSRFEGSLTEAPAVLQELRRRYRNTVWTVSALETYALCPMRFFLQSILQIKDLPPMEETLTPQERGIILHSILFRFYSMLIKKKIPFVPTAYKNEINGIARRVFNRLPVKGFFLRLEYRNMMGSAGYPGLLPRFLEIDQQKIEESGFSPKLVEWSFGRSLRKEKDPASIAEPVSLVRDKETLRLAGSIDRVDIDDLGRALILDYKSGASSGNLKPDAILNGRHFQLPLYAKILQKQYPQNPVVWAGFYILKKVDKVRRHPLIANADLFPLNEGKKEASLPNTFVTDAEGKSLTFDEILDYALDNALFQIHRLQEGALTYTSYPGEKDCREYCEYRRMCQKNKAKMMRIAVQAERP